VLLRVDAFRHRQQRRDILVMNEQHLSPPIGIE
jgi:hypothetical protein